MTAAEIKTALDNNHWALVTRGGVEYWIAQDEDANGWHAWRTPVDEKEFAVITFVEEAKYPNGVLSGDPDYSALADEIEGWLATPHQENR